MYPMFSFKMNFFQQKMFQIATGYGTSPEAQQQIYATTSHAGRTLIMSQGDGSQLGETSQIQMIRPQIQTGGISMRQDARSKINQRAPVICYSVLHIFLFG